jgi:transposase-like protein
VNIHKIGVVCPAICYFLPSSYAREKIILWLTPQASSARVPSEIEGIGVMDDVFAAPHFRDNQPAREYLEWLLWPEGPVCPHCGVVGHAYATKRPGVYRCAEKKCRKDFTVTMRTVMERSKIALHKWLQAFHLLVSSKKGISAHQLHRTLGVTYEAAWFMAHRIREAMREGGLASLGGSGKLSRWTKPIFTTFPNPNAASSRRLAVPIRRTRAARDTSALLFR